MAYKISSGGKPHWQCKAGAKPWRLSQLCKTLLVGTGVLTAASALAEVKTWTWNGTVKHSSQPAWGGDVNNTANWKDEGGNTGIPARGDTVRLAKTGSLLGWTNNNGASTNPWGDVYWTTAGANQFFLCVETGPSAVEQRAKSAGSPEQGSSRFPSVERCSS